MEQTYSSAKTSNNENSNTGNLKDSLKKEFNSTISVAKSEGKNALEARKVTAASQLHNFANATEKAAESLDKNDESAWAAPYLRQTAGQIESYAHLLQTRSMNSILEDGASLARRNPTAFVIGSLVAGICISRFLRSSAEHHSSTYNRTKNMGYGETNTTRGNLNTSQNQYSTASNTQTTGTAKTKPAENNIGAQPQPPIQEHALSAADRADHRRHDDTSLTHTSRNDFVL